MEKIPNIVGNEYDTRDEGRLHSSDFGLPTEGVPFSFKNKKYSITVYFDDTERIGDYSSELTNADVAERQLGVGEKFKPWFDQKIKPVVERQLKSMSKDIEKSLKGLMVKTIKVSMTNITKRTKSISIKKVKYSKKNVYQILQNNGASIRDFIKFSILAGASPDNTSETKMIRIERGHKPDPPLNETSQLANSVKFKVYTS